MNKNKPKYQSHFSGRIMIEMFICLKCGNIDEFYELYDNAIVYWKLDERRPNYYIESVEGDTDAIKCALCDISAETILVDEKTFSELKNMKPKERIKHVVKKILTKEVKLPYDVDDVDDFINDVIMRVVPKDVIKELLKDEEVAPILSVNLI